MEMEVEIDRRWFPFQNKPKKGEWKKMAKKMEIVTAGMDKLKVEGITRAIISGLITKMGIGQNTLITRVLADQTAKKALTTILASVKAGTKKEDITIKEKLAEAGFTSKVSLVNFSSQLKPDQVEFLEVILADEKAADHTVKVITYLFDHYEYTR